jgi:hypothetical protein
MRGQCGHRFSHISTSSLLAKALHEPKGIATVDKGEYFEVDA